jgi:hypothetical protein
VGMAVTTVVALGAIRCREGWSVTMMTVVGTWCETRRTVVLVVAVVCKGGVARITRHKTGTGVIDSSVEIGRIVGIPVVHDRGATKGCTLWRNV